VLVCSIRALKMHSGRFNVVTGKTLDSGLFRENLSAVEAGGANLRKQIENIRIFGIPVVVAINRFGPDTDNEIELVKRMAGEYGAEDVVVSLAHGQGGEGTAELAAAVVKAAEKPNNFNFLYPLDIPIKEKIKTIATKIYGADGVSYHPLAEKKIKQYTDLGFGNLPICMAKTHLSLSHDPELKGRPTGLPCQSAISGPLPERDSSIHYAEKCALCPDCPANPAVQKSISTKTGNHRIILNAVVIG
jgi:Formyltetrahydrofolate synthetase